MIIFWLYTKIIIFIIDMYITYINIINNLFYNKISPIKLIKEIIVDSIKIQNVHGIKFFIYEYSKIKNPFLN